MKRCEHLIIFTRYPEPGIAKTRLIPLLGEEGAAMIQRCMTERIVSISKKLSESRNTTIEIRYEGGSESLMKEWLGSGLTYATQKGVDLGKRMAGAFQQSFDSGAESATLVGSDIPDLSPAVLEKAFEALKFKNLVIGPASDGGYYLIGMQKEVVRTAPPLFEGISWGTESVMEETIGVARRLGLSYTILETLNDVDSPEDLVFWERLEKSGGSF